MVEKYLEDVNLGEAKKVEFLEEGGVVNMRLSIASMFVVCHRSVVEMSGKMLFEMSRYNYVTPTNYLELVAGYKK